MKQRSIKIIICIFCVALFSGCAVKIAYNLLDNILSWRLNSYVTLDKSQKKISKKTFQSFHAWHRKTQLPLYADYLEQLKSGMLKGNITGTYLHEESDKLQDMIDDAMAQLLPGLTDLAATFTPNQIKQITKKLEKDRKEFRDDYIDNTKAKIKKRRIRDISRYVGPFFGKFNNEQKAILDTWENSIEPFEEKMLGQQLHWQDELLAAMQHQHNKALLQEALRELMIYRTDNWDPELQKKLDHNQDLTFDMLATLFNSQTPKQKNKMRKKFDQYISDFRSLSSL